MPAASAAIKTPSKPGPPLSRQPRTVADMRVFLAGLNPESAAESLRLLRNAYPEAPLSLRIAACGLASD